MLSISNIQLQLKSSNSKLKQSFPEDSKADFQILFKKKKYSLKKAHLKIQSDFFAELFTQPLQSIEIKEDFDEQIFDQILSTFYGHSIEIDRADVCKCFKIIAFLKIESLKQAIRKDILTHISNYDIFILLDMAQIHEDQQLFQACFDELEKDNFQQLQLNQHELMNLNEGLFKLVIKSHNRYSISQKKKPDSTKILDLIEQYCEANEKDKQKFKEYIYQCVDVKSLTSSEFKEIFMNEETKDETKFQRKISNVYSESYLSSSSYSSSPLLEVSSKLYKSMAKNTETNQKLKIETMYLKKRIAELEHQNTILKEELKNLIKVSAQNQEIQKQMENNFRNINKQLKAELQRKHNSEVENKKVIGKFQKMLQKMHEELDKKTQQIDSIVKNLCNKQTGELIEQQYYEKCKFDSTNKIAISQFLPAAFIAKVMGEKQQKITSSPLILKMPVKSSQEQFEEDEAIESYTNRIQFNENPVSISMKYFSRFSKMMNHEGFMKKYLTLLYRRSVNHPAKGQKKDLEGHSHLLIFIRTMEMDQIGYSAVADSEEIPQSIRKRDKSFYFNAKINKKIIIPDVKHWKQAFNSQEWLINWEGHLIVPNICLGEKSHYNDQGLVKDCLQPSSDKPHLNVLKELRIKKIQIYKVTEHDMEMIV